MASADDPFVSDDNAPGVITYRELLIELREDVRKLNDAVASLAREQSRLADSIRQEQELGQERRAGMRRQADGIITKLEEHERQIDELYRWRDRADGALVLARWAMGASLVSLAAVVIQVLASIAPEIHLP